MPMYACYTVDIKGRRDWSLNEGDSHAELRRDLIRAGASWTPPTFYSLVTIRDLAPDEEAALQEDDDGQDWYDSHNYGHTCEYTVDGGTQAPQCGKPAPVMNPHSYEWFDYEEWFCTRHADPAWLAPGKALLP